MIRECVRCPRPISIPGSLSLWCHPPLQKKSAGWCQMCVPRSIDPSKNSPIKSRLKSVSGSVLPTSNAIITARVVLPTSRNKNWYDRKVLCVRTWKKMIGLVTPRAPRLGSQGTDMPLPQNDFGTCFQYGRTCLPFCLFVFVFLFLFNYLFIYLFGGSYLAGFLSKLHCSRYATIGRADVSAWLIVMCNLIVRLWMFGL